MSLYDRLHRRECRTEHCERETIREGAFCREHTDEFMATGKLPKPPEWLRLARERQHGLAKDLTGRSVA